MKKIYEADPEVMEEWNYLYGYAKFVDHHEIMVYRKTTHSFCLNFYHKQKSIGCVYVFGLKRDQEDGKIHGYVARVHVSKKFRGKGYGSIMMQDIIKNFGHCVLHISSASPNRIDDLTNENREIYRSKLYRFYEQFGFIRTSSNHTGMIRYPNGG